MKIYQIQLYLVILHCHIEILEIQETDKILEIDKIQEADKILEADAIQAKMSIDLNSFTTRRLIFFGATGANAEQYSRYQSTNNESNTFLQTLLSILSPVRVYPTPEEIEELLQHLHLIPEDDTLPRRICQLTEK